MRPRDWSRRRKFAISASATAAATALAWTAAGLRGGLAIAVVGYIATAWLSDDALGNCFIFAMLFLLVIVIVLMALVGSVLLNA
ncbi:hypothetical protein ACWPM1_09555 [Tsuneonella sp. HG249]